MDVWTQKHLIIMRMLLLDDESCIAAVYGCTSSNYEEYNPDANTNDGSCLTALNFGCTDIFSLNYNPMAEIDDGSCITISFGCNDPNAFNYDSTSQC